MARRRGQPAAPEGVLQVEHLDPRSLRAAHENWAAMGLTHERIGPAIAEAERAHATTTGLYQTKQQHRISTLKLIQPHLKTERITPFGARVQRQSLAEAGRQRARQEGGLGGADWFFEHHNLIRSAARETGTETEPAVTATTAMSPLNAPETERPAGAAMMRLVSEPHHTVKMTPELHAATKAKVEKLGGPPIPKSRIGRKIRVEELHHTHLAAIASVDADMRKKGTPTQSTASDAFRDIGATRQASSASKGIQYLRGGTPEGEPVIHPWTSPKVESYRQATLEAEPDSAEHGEFAVRLHHWIHGDPNQGVLDLFGLRHSEKGILSSGREPGPGSHTPEDTWMQSVSTRQTPLNVPGSSGRGVSVAKVVGSESRLAGAEGMRKESPSGEKVNVDPLIGGTAITHALNNAATRQAAQKVRIQMGAESTHMPVLAMHPMVWTEQRRQAEKDPQYKEAQEAEARRTEVGGRQFEVEQVTAQRKAERKAQGLPEPTTVRMGGEVLRTQRGKVRSRQGIALRGPDRTVPLPKRVTQQSMFGEEGEPTSAARIPKTYRGA